MTFDEALPLEEKLKCLRDTLERTFSEREAKTAPTPLHDADYKFWNYLKLGLATMEHSLGDYGKEEAIVREMYENGPEGKKNMSALHQLSGIMEETGRYAEAERLAREVLPWLQGNEMLGRDSPQALGCMRCLAKSVWKQGRYSEAVEWVESCRMAIEKMGSGRFEKYQLDERKQLENDVEALEKWKGERGGG